MPRFRAFCDALCLASFALWLGVVIMSGIVAAVAFPTMKSLNPSLPDFAAYPGEHWTIAAGHVARRVFDLGAMLQAGCAAIACVTLTGSALGDPRRPRRIPFARAIALLLAVGILGYWRLSLTPTMDADLDAFWAAARAGNTESADAHKAAFNAAHPVAARTLSFTALFVFAGLVETVRAIAVSFPWAKSRES
ncbi:MAG: hypothetical protein HBSAPP03_16650 [Phycisphaerae bacterium]|nr:MAG: hypothetical protein HBSAPP03_16650 [Phycisphaerae bacterium]